jgi:allantoinase
MTPHYPRDLIGYGPHPPAVRWPQGARIAVSVVLNYEEGGESCVLHGDAHSESVLTDIGADPLPDARNLNVESNFEYGSRVGFWEIMRILRERRVDATVYAVGMALERNPAAAALIADSGFEVACHGQRWIDYQFVAEDAERADMLRNIEVITRLVGKRPLGWYTGRPSANTRRLVVETGGFLYDSDAYNDDLPYFTRVAGQRHLVLPYAFDTNDMHFQQTQRFKGAADFAEYVIEAFDWLHREGDTAPKMMSIGLHLRMIGRPGRIGALERILGHIHDKGGAWVARRADIARHWLALHAE